MRGILALSLRRVSTHNYKNRMKDLKIKKNFTKPVKYLEHSEDFLAPKALDPYEWGNADFRKTWGILKWYDVERETGILHASDNKGAIHVHPKSFKFRHDVRSMEFPDGMPVEYEQGGRCQVGVTDNVVKIILTYDISIFDIRYMTLRHICMKLYTWKCDNRSHDIDNIVKSILSRHIAILIFDVTFWRMTFRHMKLDIWKHDNRVMTLTTLS